VAVLERAEDHLRALDEAAARLLHGQPEAVELDPPEPRPMPKRSRPPLM
jgi:hypothetical protein